MASIKILFKKGQATVESMLLIVVLLGLTIVVFRFMKDEEEVMLKIVDQPARYIKGMAESGVWDEVPRAKTRHPSGFYRHAMSTPD